LDIRDAVLALSGNLKTLAGDFTRDSDGTPQS
jgi:hypothetical protein